MPPPVETADEARDRPPRGSRRLVWLAVLVTLALAAALTYACTQRVPVDGAASTVRATQ